MKSLANISLIFLTIYDTTIIETIKIFLKRIRSITGCKAITFNYDCLIFSRLFIYQLWQKKKKKEEISNVNGESWRISWRLRKIIENEVTKVEIGNRFHRYFSPPLNSISSRNKPWRRPLIIRRDLLPMNSHGTN